MFCLALEMLRSFIFKTGCRKPREPITLTVIYRRIRCLNIIALAPHCDMTYVSQTSTMCTCAEISKAFDTRRDSLLSAF